MVILCGQNDASLAGWWNGVVAMMFYSTNFARPKLLTLVASWEKTGRQFSLSSIDVNFLPVPRPFVKGKLLLSSFYI